MMWKAFDPNEWHTRFAWLPVHIEGKAIWLEHYETRLIWSHVWCDKWEYRLPEQAV